MKNISVCPTCNWMETKIVLFNLKDDSAGKQFHIDSSKNMYVESI